MHHLWGKAGAHNNPPETKTMAAPNRRSRASRTEGSRDTDRQVVPEQTVATTKEQVAMEIGQLTNTLRKLEEEMKQLKDKLDGKATMDDLKREVSQAVQSSKAATTVGAMNAPNARAFFEDKKTKDAIER